jgi:hypothetical protein
MASAFIEMIVALPLIVIQVSPLMYFDQANATNFPSLAIGMRLARYSSILPQALNLKADHAPAPTPHPVCGSTSQYHIPSATSTGIWKPPMLHNRESATAVTLVCHIVCAIKLPSYQAQLKNLERIIQVNLFMGTFARSHQVPDLGAISMMEGAKD